MEYQVCVFSGSKINKDGLNPITKYLFHESVLFDVFDVYHIRNFKTGSYITEYSEEVFNRDFIILKGETKTIDKVIDETIYITTANSTCSGDTIYTTDCNVYINTTTGGTQ